MLKRKATVYIKNWIDTKNKKCLVVQGARQTGKTYIIERFAEENFEELLGVVVSKNTERNNTQTTYLFIDKTHGSPELTKIS